MKKADLPADLYEKIIADIVCRVNQQTHRVTLKRMSKTVIRLFEQFRPKHYELELDIDPDAMKFSGVVTITGFRHGRPSKRLTFHQNGLSVSSAHVTHHNKNGNTDIPIDRINNHNRLNEVRLHSPHMVYPGEYTVVLQFSGVISEKMSGMYPCSFEHEGKTKKIIATQFESHHAREVFPSIDEPEAKATFRLQLTTPAGQTVLSNTPIETQSSKGKRTTTIFETTPRMSSYLLAFAFGEIHCSASML